MRRLGLLALSLLLLLCACTNAPPEPTTAPVEQDLFCMDTVMHLKIWGAHAAEDSEEVARLLQQLEQTWSATGEDSVPSRLREGDTVDSLTEEQRTVLQRAAELSARTGGTFDPELYALSRLWGFLGEDPHVPTQQELAQAMELRQWDLGAAIKGYAGQCAAELLTQRATDGQACALLNLGGNIQTVGDKPDGTPWKIAIQNPRGDGYAGTLQVHGTMSVVTSGDYQRYFEEDGTRYHHILDPKTGFPAKSGLASVTVICGDGMTADALSTALFVLGLEKGTELWRQSTDFGAVFVLETGEVYATEGVELSGCSFQVIKREK